jgi:hypothetical protein
MSVLPEVLKANAGDAATFGAKSKLTIPPARHLRFSRAWTPGSIPRNTPDWRRAMPT